MAVLEAHFTGETNEANDLAEAVIISGPRKGEIYCCWQKCHAGNNAFAGTRGRSKCFN